MSLALSTATNSPALPKSYLQFAEEELSPDLLASYNQKATLWKVAAVASVVLFTVIAVGGFAASAYLLPVTIPLVGLCAYVMMAQAMKVYSMFEKWSDTATERATQLSAINKHYEDMSSSTPQALQEILRSKGIHNVVGMQQNDPNLTTLNPLIARHLFWEQHTADQLKIKEDKIEEARKLSEKDFVENRDTIYELNSEALEFEMQALESKVKNAFINAVLRRPHYAGTLEDLGTFSQLTGQERAMAMQAKAPHANEFFTFKNKAMPLITYNDVKRESVAELAIRMATLM